MVAISLVSKTGNTAGRFFPHSGYLGLTDVKVEGAIRTKLDDGKRLSAKSITVSVRCYEAHLGKVNALHTNVLVDYTEVLWSAPHLHEYAEVGDGEYPFRITIPANVAGHSTANYQDYRVWWRVEATLNHAHIAGVGSRQMKHLDLQLVRYDLPPQPPTPPSTSSSYLGRLASKPRSPTVRYRVGVPTRPVGPQDLVSIPISLQPVDPGISIRSASLIVERRIHIREPSATTSALASTLPIPIATHQSQSHSTPSLHSSSTPTHEQQFRYSSATATPYASTVFSDDTIRPLISQPAQPFGKGVTQCVAGVESSGRFTADDYGVCSKTLTLQWPSVKSQARWALGETLQTELASVRFFVRVKIIVSGPAGTESLDLDEDELLVVSTNDSERQIALSKYNQLADAYRSKSKSPRRSRRDRDALPSPPSSPPADTGPLLHPKSAIQSEPSSRPYTKSQAALKAKKSRRPHTSAGPSDKPVDFRMVSSPYERERQRPDEEHPFNPTEVPRTDLPLHVAVNLDASDRQPPSAYTRKRAVAPSLSSATSSSSQGQSMVSDESEQSTLDLKQVRAWEQELARIELASRRSSIDMFGIFKRKRVALMRDR